jgi:signal transduction histidine kinase
VKRYYQPLELSATPVPLQNGQKANRQSSTDPVLTAFAQLGAHRLRAKRGLITLSTRDAEYILAEATAGLGLQQDDDKNDPLWHGAGALKKECGLGMQLCKHFCASEKDIPYAVFGDLRKEDDFKNQRVVTEGPQIRFLACVPLRSPLYNMIIGTYIVVDDKPRDCLDEDELEFLVDMGVTVMDHLEAQRNNRKQYRSERMVKAIGLFIEGKSTLREWWLQYGHKAQQTTVRKRTRNGGASTLEGQADIEFGVQDPLPNFSNQSMSILSEQDGRPPLSQSPSSSTLSHLDHRGDGRPPIPSRESMFSSSDTTIRSSVFSPAPRAASVTTVDTTEGSATDHVRHSSVAFDMPPESVTADVSKELQEALLTKDLKAVFSRASNLIREAGGVDGSIFYDASVGSFGAASEKDVMGQKAPGNFHIDEGPTTSDDELARKASDTDTSAKETEDTSPSENYCSILGFSTRKRSSLKGHSPPPEYHTFPDRVLRTLLKRYPHGKVFNFDEDGSFSSSDTDNAYLGEENDADMPKRFSKPENANRRRRISREAEAAALLKALPGARSIFWFPLWDPSRERWYAGSLVYTTSPTRTLCPIEDLTYLAAFGNSIMAEVARLSALVITQMKTDFISSISHELRSPLHGVLASVEFLQETDLSEVQADMVSNINASGRVLLDTINHVLDFSKVNKKVKTKGNSFKRRGGRKARLSFPDQEGLDNTAVSTADICVLSEEVVESVWAGRNLTKAAHGKNSRAQSMVSTDHPVTVIMDVTCRPNWTFEIDAGAWRRILLNLFGNSLVRYSLRNILNFTKTVSRNTHKLDLSKFH